MELLPAIDRNGIRIVVGDTVLAEAGGQYERTGWVRRIDGVLVDVIITHMKRVKLPKQKPEPWERFTAGELVVLR